MFNQDFLKRLRVLYVEDDKDLRGTLETVLVKLFKEAVLCTNGKEGLDKILEYRDENKNFDIIISDINMPEMSGIEMLKEIREFDKEIPFIFVTAYSESKFTMEAIRFGVSHYITKPVNTQHLLLHIQEVCEAKYNQKLIEHTKIELERYSDVVNQVAIISKTDPTGKITFVNDIFCEVSKYTREELIGQNQNIIRHPDMPYFVFEELWKDIQDGKTWKGKLKNRAKDGEAYYVNTSIFPVYDDLDENIIEFVGIRFLTTQEETEKKEFRKRVSAYYRESKRKDIVSRTMINNLKDELADAKIKLKKLDNIDIIIKSLELEKEKNKKANVQIKYYENEISGYKKKYEDVVNTVTTNRNKWMMAKSDNDTKIEQLNKKLQKSEEKLTEKKQELKNEKEKSEQLNKRMKELIDVITHLDKSKLPKGF